MKTLILLGLVQTGILLLLLGKVVLFEEEMAEAGQAEQSTLVGDRIDTLPTDSSATASYYLDEDQLRKIVREELAAQLGAQSESNAQEYAAAVSGSGDEAKKQYYENQYQRELIEQQLEYYASVGRMSDKDMQVLQSQIARLDKESQKEMLSKLIKAMNSGAIEGRL